MNCCKESTGIVCKTPNKKWRVGCYICGQTTRIYKTKEEAVNRWKEITDGKRN